MPKRPQLPKLPRDLWWMVRRELPWVCTQWDLVSRRHCQLTWRHWRHEVRAALAPLAEPVRAQLATRATAAATAWFTPVNRWRDDDAAACAAAACDAAAWGARGMPGDDRHADACERAAVYAREVAANATLVERLLRVPGTAALCRRLADEVEATALADPGQWSPRSDDDDDFPGHPGDWSWPFAHTRALYEREYCHSNPLVEMMAPAARRAVVARYRGPCQERSEATAVATALAAFIARLPDEPDDDRPVSARSIMTRFALTLPAGQRPRTKWNALTYEQRTAAERAARAWSTRRMARRRDWTHGSLNRMVRDDLVAFADGVDVDSSGAKHEIIARLMAAR